jgi:hypothetical protein
MFERDRGEDCVHDKRAGSLSVAHKTAGFPSAVTLKARRWAVARRLSSPRRSVSLTISRKGRPARCDSVLSLAATSSSRVSVVRMH